VAIVFTFGSMSGFYPGEEILHTVHSIGFMSTKALPSYRLFFPLPPLWRVSLYITDKRAFLVAYLFGVVIQEFITWYPGRAPAGDHERVHSTRVGKLKLFGRYLELVSYNSRRPWYWRCICSPSVRMRFYLKNPEPLYESLRANLKTENQDS